MSNLPPRSLRDANTFGLECHCRGYARFTDAPSLRLLLQAAESPVLILGGGSNLLLPEVLHADVLHNAIPGIVILDHQEDSVIVEAGAGESWHGLVTWAVEQGLGGLENLALIPGTVGAAPIQNIGAYGVELQDVFLHLEAMHRASGEIRRFDRQECAFGYRDSLFKQGERDQWVILRVAFRLSTSPALRLDYGDIRQVLQEKAVARPGIRDVFEAVVHIRRSKLPDPGHLGNAGSFFKNPVISEARLAELRAIWPDLPAWPQEGGGAKIPAAWLIDRAGWKGHRRGACGVHDRQALVLVNYGGARPQELIDLARDIVRDIRLQYGVHLENEVNMLDEMARPLSADDPDSMVSH